MELLDLVHLWFERWESGDFEHIPVEEGFRHTSPYGIVAGKTAYLSMIQESRDSFLGFEFEIHDELYGSETACVRYTGRKGDYALEATEWFFKGTDLIEAIVSYYDRS